MCSRYHTNHTHTYQAHQTRSQQVTCGQHTRGEHETVRSCLLISHTRCAPSSRWHVMCWLYVCNVAMYCIALYRVVWCDVVWHVCVWLVWLCRCAPPPSLPPSLPLPAVLLGSCSGCPRSVYWSTCPLGVGVCSKFNEDPFTPLRLAPHAPRPTPHVWVHGCRVVRCRVISLSSPHIHRIIRNAWVATQALAMLHELKHILAMHISRHAGWANVALLCVVLCCDVLWCDMMWCVGFCWCFSSYSIAKRWVRIGDAVGR